MREQVVSKGFPEAEPSWQHPGGRSLGALPMMKGWGEAAALAEALRVARRAGEF